MTAEELKEWKKKPLEGDDKIFEISRDVHDEERRIDIMRDRMAQYYTLTRVCTCRLRSACPLTYCFEQAINYLDIPLMLHTMLKAMNQFITGLLSAICCYFLIYFLSHFHRLRVSYQAKHLARLPGISALRWTCSRRVMWRLRKKNTRGLVTFICQG